MQPLIFIILSLSVFVFLIAFLLVVFRKAPINDSTDARRPRGFWVGAGMNFGLAIGVALGFAIDLIARRDTSFVAFGIGIGMALGTTVGLSLEKKHKDELRPLTEAEKKRQRLGISVGLIVTTLLVLMFIVLYLMSGSQ